MDSEKYKKLKIAIIVGPFPCTSETFILNHITSLIDAGHEVDVFAFGKSPDKQIYHESALKYGLDKKVVYLFPIPYDYAPRIKAVFKAFIRSLLRNPLWMVRCFQKKSVQRYSFMDMFILAGHFMKKKYDVIHCHFGTNARKLYFLKEIFHPIKYIVTFHGFDIRKGLEEANGYYKGLFKAADKVIAICDYNCSKLVEMGCPEDKIQKLFNMIDTDTFKNDTRKTGGPFTILMVGRFVKEKNYEFALRIVKALKDDGITDFKYVAIGDGPLKNDLKQKINEYGIKDLIELKGALPQMEVKNIFCTADMLLLTSLTEGLPVVVMEAQSMGLPVVATDVGGVKQSLIDGKTGYLITLNDVSQAKEKILQLKNDLSLRKQMGEEGRRFVLENFDSKKIKSRLMNIYVNG